MANESLILNPNSRQVGSMLGYKPVPQETNPNAVLPVEVSFTRNSVGMEKRSDGLWHQVPVNMPRRYWDGTKYSWLFEPQATNINIGANGFGWNGTGIVTGNFGLSPQGTTNAFRVQIGSGQYERCPTFTMLASTTYTVSSFIKNNGTAVGQNVRFYVNNNSGVNPLTVFANVDINNLTATVGTVTGATNVSVSIRIESNGYLFVALTFTSNASTGSAVTELGFDSIGNTFDILAWGTQFETGSVATSPIITAGSAVTRVVDNYSRALSAMNQGSAIVKIPDNIIVGGIGTHVFGIFILAGTGIGIYLSRIANGRNRLWTQAATTIFQTTVDDLKLGITWNGTSISVWQNGVKVVTDFSFALTGVVNLLNSANLETPNLIDEIILYNTVLSDVEMGDLTQ